MFASQYFFPHLIDLAIFKNILIFELLNYSEHFLNNSRLQIFMPKAQTFLNIPVFQNNQILSKFASLYLIFA